MKQVKIYTRDEMSDLKQEGLTNEILIRNYHIRVEYVILRQENYNAESCFQTLSERYFLSEKQIQRIIYQK